MTEAYKPSIKKLPTFRRETISISSEKLIKIEFIPPEITLSLVIKHNVKRVNLLVWTIHNENSYQHT